MPTYCFTTADGTVTVERRFRMRSIPQSVGIGYGRTAFRDIRAEHCGFVNTPGNYPMESDAAGVGASQVKEAEAHSRAIGISTHFTSDGAAIFTSSMHRKRYCEAVGLFDRNGGYGEPQRSR